MSVSRDFIDSYSPEVPICYGTRAGSPWGPRRHHNCGADDGLTKLAFRFQTLKDSLQSPITFHEAGRFVLGLAQKPLQRLIQADRLVDFDARSSFVGPEP